MSIFPASLVTVGVTIEDRPCPSSLPGAVTQGTSLMGHTWAPLPRSEPSTWLLPAAPLTPQFPEPNIFSNLVFASSCLGALFL